MQTVPVAQKMNSGHRQEGGEKERVMDANDSSVTVWYGHMHLPCPITDFSLSSTSIPVISICAYSYDLLLLRDVFRICSISYDLSLAVPIQWVTKLSQYLDYIRSNLINVYVS